MEKLIGRKSDKERNKNNTLKHCIALIFWPVPLLRCVDPHVHNYLMVHLFKRLCNMTVDTDIVKCTHGTGHHPH